MSFYGDLPERPLLCHYYHVRLSLQNRYNEVFNPNSRDGIFRAGPAGLPLCFREDDCSVGLLYFGYVFLIYSIQMTWCCSSSHMYKFIDFVNATGGFDKICRYSAENQGIVCDPTGFTVGYNGRTTLI
jgi:hypothetical protein